MATKNSGTLGVTAKAKDEVSGEMAKATKAFENAAKSVEGANKRVAVSEKEKREALKQAREAQAAAKKSADDLRLALGGLGGALELAGKKAGFSAKEMVLWEKGIELGIEAASAAIGAVVDVAKAIGDAFVDSLKSASAFGFKMAEVSTLVDTGAVNIGELTKFTLQLAGTFGQAPIDEARALYQAISSGAFKAEEATAIMTTANKLAAAGITDVFTALDGLTSVVNAFGGSMREAGPVADAMFVAMRDGKTTIPELASAIGKVASTARASALTFDETAAAIAAITTKGVATDEAVTSLNNALTKIQKPSKEAREEAHRLGIEFNVAGVVHAGGFAKFLDKIRTSEKLTSESIGHLFGNIRGIKGVFALTNDEGLKFNQILEDMTHKAGSVERGLAKISDTVEFQTKRFDALKSSISIAFGELVTESEGAKGFMLGLNESMTLMLQTLLTTGTGTLGARDAMRKLAREGIAEVLEGLAGLLESLPGVENFLKNIVLIASVATSNVSIATRAAIIASITAGSEQAKGQISTLQIAANKARGLAEAIRSGAEASGAAVQAEAEIERQANEERARQLKEIERLTKNAAGAGGGKKEAAAAERERLRRVREDVRELEKQDKEVAQNKIKAEIEFNKFATDNLKKQYEEAKAIGEKMKQERDARDRREIEAENRLIKTREQANEAMKSVAGALYGGFRNAFDAIITKQKTFGEAMLAWAEEIGLQILDKLALSLIGKAIDAFTGGLGGGALGILGSIFGFSKGGIVPQPKRMADGGIVSGGRPGFDSVPVLAMPDEAFLSVGLTRALRSALAVPDPPRSASSAAPASSAMSGGGNTIVLAPQYHSSVPMSSADTDRHYRDSLLPALKRMLAQGHLDFMFRRRS